MSRARDRWESTDLPSTVGPDWLLVGAAFEVADSLRTIALLLMVALVLLTILVVR